MAQNGQWLTRTAAGLTLYTGEAFGLWAPPPGRGGVALALALASTNLSGGLSALLWPVWLGVYRCTLLSDFYAFFLGEVSFQYGWVSTINGVDRNSIALAFTY